jgi:hypothetical protein
MAAKFPKYFLFKRYMDSGHSWFAVRRIWLERLQIEHKISPFSYEKNKQVYLEEDSDWDVFATALLAKGIKYDWKTVYQNGDSPIRKYFPYHFSYNKYNDEKASWFNDGEIHLHTIQGKMIYQVGDSVYDIIKRKYFPANLFRVDDAYYQWANELPLSTAKE